MRTIDADALKEDLTRFYYGEVTARDLIDEQPTVGGWISVKDRLPENGKFVVVRHEVKGRVYSEVAHYIMNLWWLDWDSNGLELNAISWMPLPEPPEEVSGDALQGESDQGAGVSPRTIRMSEMPILG